MQKTNNLGNSNKMLKETVKALSLSFLLKIMKIKPIILGPLAYTIFILSFGGGLAYHSFFNNLYYVFRDPTHPT
jgi:hypothetical protein